jgi:cation:H+ antiporter
MDLALAIGAMVVGFTVAVLASRVAVEGASDLVSRTRIPPFVIGLTLVAVGTDLPEIVNSLVASFQGFGDINAGDSIGSALTQTTLVLGLLPLLGGAFVVPRRRTSAIGIAIVASLLLGAALMGDGDLSRLDGGILLGAWVLASLLVWRQGVPPSREAPPESVDGRARRSVLELIGGLVVITAGVMLAIWGTVEVAESAGVPAYLISFFGASLGTSLPELVFDVTALRRGQTDIAVGDVFGSSLVDATLSIGIGPLFFPTLVTADLVVRGSLFAAGIIAIATMLLVSRRRHTWVSGLILIGLYLALYPVLLA